MKAILAAVLAAAAVATVGQARAATASTGTPLLNGVKLHETNVMQSFARDSADGSFIFAQVSDKEHGLTPGGNEARGDLTLTRVSQTGKIMSYMLLRNFDHGMSISAEVVGRTLYIWAGAKLPVYPAPSGSGSGSQVARFKWASGKTIWPTSAGVRLFNPVPGAVRVTPSLDLPDGLVAVRYQDAGGSHVATYPLTAFEAGDFTPAAVYAEPALAATVQGWGVLPGGHSFALLTGDATSASNPVPGNTNLTVWDSSGVTSQLFLAEIPKASHREPEGVDGFTLAGRVCNGWATGPVGGRRASVYCRPASQ